LGAAESVVGISDAFKPHPERRGLYRPNNAFRAAKPSIVAAIPQPAKVAAMASR